MPDAPRILAISASLRTGSHTLTLVRAALDSAAAHGAETRLLDLRLAGLPLYEAEADYDDNPAVADAIAAVDWAQGIILGSPEYHGCMSGAAKNLLDFLYREVAGKPFGLVAATGGSQGVSCFDNMRAAVQYCHGWTLPYAVGASGRAFDPDSGAVADSKVADRLARLGRDIAIYAPLLHAQFVADRAASAGFAQW